LTEKLFTLRQGASPLVVSIPHAGTHLPEEIAARLTPIGRRMVDTDWHVDRLYDFLPELDATVLVATHSRSVVDLNRAPDGARLYPGQAETGLCPTETFAGEPLYDGDSPDEAERAARIAQYWQPYHNALAAELARIKALHGAVHLLDAHSIASEIPRLFPGRLPDLNFGTNSGAACEAGWAARAMQAAEGGGFSMVLDGRFKGGAITRHYGNPAACVRAIQLELAWCSYLDEQQPEIFDPSRAAPLASVLRRVAEALSLAWQV
jgi:N-formylglutamate deformylase